MYNSIKITEDGKSRMKITDQDEFVPDSLYLEEISAFAGVTELLYEFMGGNGRIQNPIRK
jgi:hypothetical protein